MRGASTSCSSPSSSSSLEVISRSDSEPTDVLSRSSISSLLELDDEGDVYLIDCRGSVMGENGRPDFRERSVAFPLFMVVKEDFVSACSSVSAWFNSSYKYTLSLILVKKLDVHVTINR